MQSKGEILIYKAKDGSQQLEVKLEEDTVWLSQKQMAELFDKNPMTVNGHISNIFKEKELDQKSVIRKSLITASDGKNYETLIYNLDVIISIGYRVNSKRGTQFRQWATQRLKDHLVKGYTLNEKRLQQVVQTFGGEYLYRSIEEQAAHLLYFVIKNHPFTDGNKRIGAFLFVWFLEKNKHRFKKSGEVKINDNALVALALLVAQSNPDDKEIMVKLVVNLIRS